jgi:hypothetical protein
LLAVSLSRRIVRRLTCWASPTEASPVPAACRLL